MPEKANDYINAIVVITSMITLVAGFVCSYVLYFKKRRVSMLREKVALKEEFRVQLLQSQIEVQETTYTTLAKELHDNVGQLLSTAKMLLALTERSLQPPPDTLVTATATVGEAIHEVRALSRAIDKEWLAQFSFYDNIKAEMQRINSSGAVAATCDQTGSLPLTGEEQLMLFRIVQEAVQNAVKHAAPGNIHIKIGEEPAQLNIAIINDGSSFSGLPADAGMGTNNMQRRVLLLGGKITWNPLPAGGTCVDIVLPFKHSRA